MMNNESVRTPDISEFNALLDQLDILFNERPGFTPYEDGSLVIFDDVSERLKFIDEYKNKFVSERLRAFYAYNWFLSEDDLKTAFKLLRKDTTIRSSYDKSSYDKLALKIIKRSGYKGGNNFLKKLRYGENELDYFDEYTGNRRSRLNVKKRLGLKGPHIEKLKIKIESYYENIWGDEIILWKILPAVIDFYSFSIDEKSSRDIAKDSGVNTDIEAVKKSVTKSLGLCKKLQKLEKSSRIGTSYAIGLLKDALNALSCIQPELPIKRDSKNKKFKLFVMDMTSQFITNGGVSIGDGKLYKSKKIPKERQLIDVYGLEEFSLSSAETIVEENLECPVAVLMENDGSLRKINLTTADSFTKKTANLEFDYVDLDILEVWRHDGGYFGIKRTGYKYMISDIVSFISKVADKCSSGIEKGSSDYGWDSVGVRNIVQDEVLRHSIVNEILQRLSHNCTIPNKKNNYSLLTII